MLALKLSRRHVMNTKSQTFLFPPSPSVSLQIKAEVTEDVYTSRKKQHQTMMHYFCALNTLQYKKKIAMLEPLLGYMQAQVNSDRESCRSERRCRSTSWRLMDWNPAQDLSCNAGEQMEKKPYPIHIPVAVRAAAVNAGTSHFPLSVWISSWHALPFFSHWRIFQKSLGDPKTQRA